MRKNVKALIARAAQIRPQTAQGKTTLGASENGVVFCAICNWKAEFGESAPGFVLSCHLVAKHPGQKIGSLRLVDTGEVFNVEYDSNQS